MGKVNVQVKLIKYDDVVLLKKNIISNNEVRTWNGEALVDTGATLLIIPKKVADKLGILPYRKVNAKLPGKNTHEVGIARGVLIGINNREALVECAIYDGDGDVLIGLIPLENMDWHVDCKNNRLVPRPESPDAPMIEIL